MRYKRMKIVDSQIEKGTVVIYRGTVGIVTKLYIFRNEIYANLRYIGGIRPDYLKDRRARIYAKKSELEKCFENLDSFTHVTEEMQLGF